MACASLALLGGAGMEDGSAHACTSCPTTLPLPRACRWVAVNEVRLLASLHHPNVVQYKQCFVEDNCLYVIMEVVPNGELAAAVE